jgi:hypothetical protein
MPEHFWAARPRPSMKRSLAEDVAPLAERWES